MKIIVYDLETTGLEITVDAIIEGYFYDIVAQTCIHIICDPEIPISPEVSDINGWTNLDLKGYKPFRNHVKDLVEFCSDDCIFIAHNNDKFDKLMLLTNLKNNGFTRPKNWKFVDTYKLAQIAYPDLDNYKQDTLQKKFNITVGNNHRANKDVLDLDKIYIHMCKDLNMDPIKDIMDIWKLSRNWIPVKMPFGKHKGTMIKDLPDGYKTWLKMNGDRDIIKALKAC